MNIEQIAKDFAKKNRISIPKTTDFVREYITLDDESAKIACGTDFARLAKIGRMQVTEFTLSIDSQLVAERPEKKTRNRNSPTRLEVAVEKIENYANAGFTFIIPEAMKIADCSWTLAFSAINILQARGKLCKTSKMDQGKVGRKSTIFGRC